jgi:hypothetical protein
MTVARTSSSATVKLSGTEEWPRVDKRREGAEHEPLGGVQIWGSSPRPGEEEQLLLEEQVLSDD